jgi:hypothetical protein
VDVGQAIALASGIGGLIATLWKVFNIIRALERQIEEIENELEKQVLIINGVRERLEHTRSRFILEIGSTNGRVSHNETWLTKHTEFEPLHKG